MCVCVLLLRGIEARVLCEYVHNANKFAAYIWGHLETPRKPKINESVFASAVIPSLLKAWAPRASKTCLRPAIEIKCSVADTKPLQVQMEEASMSTPVASNFNPKKNAWKQFAEVPGC